MNWLSELPRHEAFLIAASVAVGVAMLTMKLCSWLDERARRRELNRRIAAKLRNRRVMQARTEDWWGAL